MPFTPKFVDLVKNFTLVQGTGPVSLSQDVTGFTSFAAACVTGDQFYYCIQGVDRPVEREVGRGTMLSNGTISREPIGAPAFDFTKGKKSIALVTAAEWMSQVDAAIKAPPSASPGETLFVDMAGMNVPPVRSLIRSAGYSQKGIGGADFVEDPAVDAAFVANSATPAFLAADGRGFRIDYSQPLSATMFGVKGDGVTNDGAAIARIGAYLTARGGGHIRFEPWMNCPVGSQTLHASPNEVDGGLYNWAPDRWYICEVSGCTKPVIIDLNGARIFTANGGKYGTFNDDGSPKAVAPGYYGVGASTPFYQMFYIHGCTGGGWIGNGELDGNIGGQDIGGPFSDTGIQLQHTGLLLKDNFPAICDRDLHAHHFGLDALIYDGPATSADAVKEQYVSERLHVHNNGRNNISVVGGRGGIFRSLLNYNAGKGVVGANATSITSNPASGIDFEAEGGKIIREWATDEQSMIYDCANQCVVADSGLSSHIDIRGYIGNATNYALWLNKPYCSVTNAVVQGTCVQFYTGTSDPDQTVKCTNVRFSDDPAEGPLTTVYDVNGHFVESGAPKFTNCTFVKTNGVNGGVFDALYDTCTFIAKNGVINCYGKYQGRNFFVEQGTGRTALPGGLNFTIDVGLSYSPFRFRNAAGVETIYQANSDGINKLTTEYDASWASGDFALQVPGAVGARYIHGGTLTGVLNIPVQDPSPVGSRFRVMRAATGAFDMNVRIGTAGGTILKALTAPDQFVEVEYLQTYGWKVVASS